MRSTIQPRSVLTPLVVVFLAASAPSLGEASGVELESRLDGERVVVTIGAEEYGVVDTPEGRMLDIAGFGSLKVPGEPKLPLERLLVALPPGARAESIEILSVETIRVPGVQRILPAPPFALLPDMPRWDSAMQRMQREWDEAYDRTYSSDAPFPEELAWIIGRGAYKAYSYVAVAVCPFTYHPASGRLDHHKRIEVAIRFGFPPMPHGAGRSSGLMKFDPESAQKASRLFCNYEQVAALYSPAGSEAATRDEIHDYVIITTADLLGAIESSDFPAWKSDRGYSLRTVLTTDAEIAGQPGPDLAAQIRSFLRHNYSAWGIKYVLLVGDYQTVPMRICYPDPDNHVYNPWDPGLVAPGTPTDYYYADLSYEDAISWDSDGDGFPGEYGDDDPDFLAEVSVGRIPVDDPVRITYSLDKLVAFEQDSGDWKRNVLHGAAILFFENQDHGDVPFIDGATCLDSIETGLMQGWSITHLSEQAGIVKSAFDWPALMEYSFTNNWGSGAHGVVNWSGHGWCDGAYRTVWAWDDGDGVPESGNGELQSYRFIGTNANYLDDDHPSIVFAISCNVGYPDPNAYGNLGIDLLTLPGWGSSAGIVSSARPAAISRDWKNDPGGTEQICYEFNRYMIAEGRNVGDALYEGKFNATTYYGWDRVYEYMNLYNFNLFGDPSLGIGTNTVEVSEAAATRTKRIFMQPGQPNPFQVGTTIRANLPLAGLLRVTVHDVSGRRVATLRDGRGEAGLHVISWDGTGDHGQRIAPGLYFIIADDGGSQSSRKVIRLN